MDEPTLNDPLLSGEQRSADNSSKKGVWPALQRSWIRALPVGIVLAVIICAALLYFNEPRFRSVAMLVIHDRSPIVMNSMSDPPPDFAETQIEMLRSAHIIGQALAEESLGKLPELAAIEGREDAVKWIQERLTAVRIGKSELYEVSFTAGTPLAAQRIADAIVQTYLRYLIAETDSDRKLTLEILAREKERYDQEIVMLRTRLRELAKMTGRAEGIVAQRPRLDELGAVAAVGRSTPVERLQQRLADTEIELATARAQVATATEEMDQPIQIPESRFALALLRDPGILQLTIDIQTKKKKLAGAAPDDLVAPSLREEIAVVEEVLENRKNELLAALKAEAEEAIVQQRRLALSQAKAELRSKESTVEALDALLRAEQNGPFSDDKSLELQFARDELDKVVSIRQHISDRIHQVTTESQARGAVQRVTKEATLPEFPEGPTPAPVILSAGAFAFLAPFVVCTPWVLYAARPRKKMRRTTNGFSHG
jgi:uncharacterized protein involved in exopolysaccharide biosynthesis